jgi:hypothetical protein
MSVSTIPAPLEVVLSNAVATDTFVAVTSSDEMALTVVGGGVTVPAGQVSAPVVVTTFATAGDVTLTASLGMASHQATVRVLGAGELPQTVTLTPPSATIGIGATITFTVTLDIPAPAGGASVGLALAPMNAGTVPASVQVAADQLSATFDVTNGGMEIDSVLTATLGMSTSQATIDAVTAPTGLVINEIDYDQIGTDGAEFVEIYNPGPGSVSLAGVALVLVNGNGNAEYRRIDLTPAGSLAPGNTLVVGATAVTVQPPALKLTPAVGEWPATDAVQNGAPDGVALVDTTNGVVLDALSYEGAMTMAMVNGIGVVSLVEGTALPAGTADSNTVAGSLSRLPNGTDTNNAATDWAFSASPTPGAANVP